MGIRKFSICTKCWLKSGSKSFILLTKKCELLQADSLKVKPLMPERGELCFSATLPFCFLFLPSPSYSPLFPFPCSSAMVSFTSSSPSFLCLFVGAHCHLHSCVFFSLCPSYSHVPHGIWSWQLFWLELAFTPTGVITPHCFSTHVTAELFPSTEQRGGFYK